MTDSLPKPIPNQLTINLYKEVMKNVINSVGDQWKKIGGDYAVLQNIAELWEYQTMKKCNIDIPEPQSRGLQRAKQKKETASTDLFNIIGLDLQQDKKEDGSSSEADYSNSGSELGSSDSDTSKSGSDSSSSDGLGSTDDSEIDAMVTPCTSDNQLYCQFENVVKKKKKLNKLHVVNAHFTINGVPRVVKNGIIELP